MDYKIVNLNEKIVVGKSIITTNENSQCIKDIGSMWQEFIGGGIFNSIENKINGMGIGLYTDYEGDATKPYRFMCCTEVNENNNPDLECRTICDGKYAKFTIKGHMINDVGRAWNEIWSMDLDRRFHCDFEVYHNDSEDISNQTIDIYISIN
ncbi:MAG: GyrI-like domain-containing protein [Anaeromicrobium sp.]|jgi:predicted transcriptional regulator YdeE|uniref:GyrI-like domain-containing protein n=1 Tax=Anaeromicrobium sp. TaxID=1929132 RepID=UPI0025E3937D|nr:GyrI-like domain-containing protein [Anaeromicrobium sp.]MCT4595876.1 GyrI-like domain-containing protein [Anaeromicrobium sp.]